jgi:hypothetical protein
MISDTRIFNGNNGIVVGVNANVEVTHSIVSGMTAAAVQVSAASGIVDVESTVLAHSGTGIQNVGIARISNSEIAFNTTGISGNALSYSNNRFKSNGTDGTIIPIGATTNPTGPALT